MIHLPKTYRQTTAMSLVALASTVTVGAFAAEQGGQIEERAEEVVVTGTRIVRDGYEAPTPVTVVGAEIAQQSASANIADVLRTLPTFSGSLNPSQGAGGPSSFQGGLNTLDLRNLGANRTLILIDGQRTVSSRTDGVVDINNIPQQLISRIDIVTGGASAVYGSDAVSGVVNFILDKEFTGFKGEVSSGTTSYGDSDNYKVALTGGFPFAGGRGHLVASGEIYDKEGVNTNYRPWNRGGAGIITNPDYTGTNGQPQYLVRDDVSLWYPKGGIIDRGPLLGTAFGQGGQPYMFDFGSTTSGIYTAGGDYNSTLVRADTISLNPTERREGIFLRAGYDLSENVELFAQISWNSSYDDNKGFPHYQAGNGPTILSGNPFIPASVQAQMDALGLTSIHLGSMNYDLPIIGSRSTRKTSRNALGLNGSSTFLNTDWAWKAYVQNGTTDIDYNSTGVTRRSRRALAADAVIHPTTGVIVCRSSLTDPDNGCKPYNPMGIGVNGEDVIHYLTSGGAFAHVDQELTQNLVAASITGEPFSNWAGPVSIALSAEHRIEKAVSRPDEVTLLADWQAGNFLPLDAKYDVTEGAIETLIPLAQGVPFVDSWDLTAAFRATQYSTSGYVSTWKVGTTYSPIQDVTFRATRSRDIRAPNLSELFQENVVGFNTGFDPFTGTVPTFLVAVNGNTNLRPEKADTINLGVVFQPSFAPGLSLSVDYWSIEVSDAIALPSFAKIIQFCFEGSQEYCGNLTRTDGVITNLIQSPFNMAVQETRGIDFEASYGMPLSSINESLPGEIGLRAYATKYLESYINNGLSAPQDTVGENRSGAPPDWNLTTRLEYTLDRFSASLTGRAMSSGTMYNAWVECSSACPPSTIDNRTIDDNKLPGYFYLDAGVSFTLDVGGTNVETFLNIRNLMNKDPGIVPRTADDFGYVVSLTNPVKYDMLGRVYRAGVRFKF